MKQKDLAEAYLAKAKENAIYFKDGNFPNMPLFQEKDIKAAFNAGRESVLENIPYLKWYKSSEEMTARTLFGMYSFSKSNALWFYAYRGVHLFFDTHKTFEDAKKVAHRDYKEWIKQALGL